MRTPRNLKFILFLNFYFYSLFTSLLTELLICSRSFLFYPLQVRSRIVAGSGGAGIISSNFKVSSVDCSIIVSTGHLLFLSFWSLSIY